MTPILVCESVRATTLAGLVRARQSAQEADLVELRLDGVADPDPAGALAGRTHPAIVTCRPRWEGGAFEGDEETRQRLLEEALHAGAEFVDVEWKAPWRDEFVRRWAKRVVLSWHDFSETPADIVERATVMAASPAAVVKVAVTTRCLRDLEPLLAIQRHTAPGRRMVIIGMGDAGAATRILPQRFGSQWTYAGLGVAPGQIPAGRLIREYRVRTASTTTMLFGLVGRPVAHSLSPAMHNAAFAACELDARYVPFHASTFDDFRWAADALQVLGASVTAPFKEDAFRMSSHGDAQANGLEVANTLRREADGAWSARNTDVQGFLAPLEGVELRGSRVAVIGAGGAARAVVSGLTQRGAVVTIHARRSEAARALADRLGVAAGEWPPPGGADILVNTTPVGTWPGIDESPVQASIVQGSLVYDLVYNPPQTALLRAATEQGCRTIDGLEMLVSQAAAQFEWWTGSRAPMDVMRAAASRRLEEFRAETLGTGLNR